MVVGLRGSRARNRGESVAAGTPNLGLARAIAESAELLFHDIDRAHGELTVAQHAEAEARWRESRRQLEQARGQRYEDGLRALESTR